MLSSNMTYVVAGAAAIVLIVLVLVLVMARSRSRNTQVAAGLHTRQEWTSLADPAMGSSADTASDTHVEPWGEDAGDGPVAPIEPASPLHQPASVLDRPEATPAESVAALEQPAATLDLRPGIDPVVTLITSLLQNSGDLDPEEIRRLELFRPERIVTAVDALTPTLAGRNNESKRARLARIRQYADSLTAKPTDEPATTDVFVAADPAPFRPPEVWGVDAGETTLALDPELSLLDEQPPPPAEVTPAAEAEPAPAFADAALHQSAPPEPTPLEPGDEKKTAIDALVRDATPEALSRLQRYLDDPDPEIQLHALSAAERLLGPE